MHRPLRLLPSAFVVVCALVLASAGSAVGAVRFFLSPSGNLSCEVADHDPARGSHAFCQSVHRPKSVRMGPDGRLHICRGERCLGNPPENATTLAFGHAIRVGRYRCTSRSDGLRCRVVATGRGFLINRDVVRRLT